MDKNRVLAMFNFMFKKLFIIFCLLSLANCSMPNTALLGPIFTGARTGSVYQASLSFGTSKIMNEFNELKQKDSYKKFNSIMSDKFINNKKKYTKLTYIVDPVEMSVVIEPEPLP